MIVCRGRVLRTTTVVIGRKTIVHGNCLHYSYFLANTKGQEMSGMKKDKYIGPDLDGRRENPSWGEEAREGGFPQECLAVFLQPTTAFWLLHVYSTEPAVESDPGRTPSQNARIEIGRSRRHEESSALLFSRPVWFQWTTTMSLVELRARTD